MKTLVKILAVVMVASVLTIGSTEACNAPLDASWRNIVSTQHNITTQYLFQHGLRQNRLVWGCPCIDGGSSFLIFWTPENLRNGDMNLLSQLLNRLASDEIPKDYQTELTIGHLSHVKGNPSIAEAGIQADLEISMLEYEELRVKVNTVPSVIHLIIKPNGYGDDYISSEITSSFMGYIHSDKLQEQGLGIKVELIYDIVKLPVVGDLQLIGDVKMQFTAVPRPDGDLNGDCDVDMNDLNIIKANLNKFASACPKCDLDKDGKITVLDAKKLMNMCSRPNCVCP
jgi:hypothetical protein